MLIGVRWPAEVMVDRPGVEHQSFSEAGFSCVDMGKDAQILCARSLSSSQNCTGGFDEKGLGVLGPLCAKTDCKIGLAERGVEGIAVQGA